MSAFKAYDFRGKYGIDFSLEEIYRIGYFLPQLLDTDKILVGRDMRLSTPEMFGALAKGITDHGADVYDMGLCTTPMVYYFTAKHHFNASVMITASHNPKEYNGLKISRKDALPVGFDSGLAELEQMVLHDTVKPGPVKGKIVDYPVKAEYLEFLSPYRDDLSGLKIAIDCSNGTASLIVHDIFGEKPDYLYDEPDGHFPHHEPNPLDPSSIVDLQQHVLRTGCDIGLIFDGDADRVMFVDEKGQFISPDLMIAVLGLYFLDEQKNSGKVLVDIRTSKSVSEFLEKLGGKMETWRVGRAYAALKLREIDGIFGGEFAGHYYFRDFFYSDSAMMAALILLHIFKEQKRKGITVSALIAQIATYANSGEINFIIRDKTEAMEALKNHFIQQEEVYHIMDFDGYRIEFKDWWFNIRPSNTEPYLRLLMEARTPALLEKKLEEAGNILHFFEIKTE